MEGIDVAIAFSTVGVGVALGWGVLLCIVVIARRVKRGSLLTVGRDARPPSSRTGRRTGEHSHMATDLEEVEDDDDDAFLSEPEEI